MTKTPSFDLESEGVRELIRLTNKQFGVWNRALARETTDEIPAGDRMHYWFILSELALHPPDFRVIKKELCIPNLAGETVRKHAAAAGRLGFVQTVKLKNMVYLQLTPQGQRALTTTMASWVEAFGDIQRKYFQKATVNLRE